MPFVGVPFSPFQFKPETLFFLSAPTSQRFLRFAIAICPSRTPEIWKVASDLRFRAAISEPKATSFCGISGDLAPSTRKSLAIAIVRFWCAKSSSRFSDPGGGVWVRPRPRRPPPETVLRLLRDVVGIYYAKLCLFVCHCAWSLSGFVCDAVTTRGHV